MRSVLPALIICCATTIALSSSLASSGPASTAPIRPIAPPRDRPYPGEIQLQVDATDVTRRVIHVHEILSGVGLDGILLYPQWPPGTHAPEGTIDRLGGLRITADGAAVSWARDPADVWALRVHAPHRGSTLQIDFDYLSPTSPDVGDLEISPNLLMIEWNELVLYPAGYFVRQIPVQADLTLPVGWQFASALERMRTSAQTSAQTQTQGTRDAARTRFTQVSLATLVDSPLYAGRYTSRLDLDPGASVPVHLNLFADRPSLLAISPAALQAYRSLIQQAYRLFGSHHYSHYDFLYSLSDQIQQSGLEHQQSSENGTAPDSLTEWDKNAWARDLLPHEYVHSWNGKFRRPFDLWTPNYNVPMQDSLLWVYEGQTQYWGHVLAARAGLRTREQTLDELALIAADDQVDTGRQWRALQDTTNDEIINPRRPQSWRNWQRFEDYYNEGALIWLDADTLIRERSGGRRSLDDFARAFFGIDNGSVVTVTYTFDDLVRALNAVQPYDWAGFLRARLDLADRPPPLDGLRRGGYRLVYTDTQDDYQRDEDAGNHRINLQYSIGLSIDDKTRPGGIEEVVWSSPAFRAGLTTGGQILSVNGVAYGADILRDAIQAARTDAAPIELIVKTGDAYRVARVDYHGGLRYPHLQRDTTVPARLDAILAARP